MMKKIQYKKTKNDTNWSKKPKMTRFCENYSLFVDLTQCTMSVQIKIKKQKLFIYD